MTIFFDTLDTKILLFEVYNMQMMKYNLIPQESAKLFVEY
jgi:hypothetical protein